VDGGFVVAGATASGTGEVTGNHGASDYWVVKLSQCVLSAAPVVIRTADTLTTAMPYYTYQWYVNGTLIPGATNATYTISDSGHYSVKVVDSMGCNGLSTNYSVPPLQIVNVDVHPNVRLLPNPATNIVNIFCYGNYSVTLYNTTGSAVKTQENCTSLSIADVPPGLYYIKVTGANGVIWYWDKLLKL
jgi:hypothetical protein